MEGITPMQAATVQHGFPVARLEDIMQKYMQFHDCLIAVTASRLVFLVDGPDELKSEMTMGDAFDDNCLKEGCLTLPTKPGFYRATVEWWFQQGYFEGYEAPGESDVDFRLRDIRRIVVPDRHPSVEHCDISSAR